MRGVASVIVIVGTDWEVASEVGKEILGPVTDLVVQRELSVGRDEDESATRLTASGSYAMSHDCISEFHDRHVSDFYMVYV